jgi:hypothetical protein
LVPAVPANLFSPFFGQSAGIMGYTVGTIGTKSIGHN